MKKFLSLLLVTLTIFGCLFVSTGCTKSETPNLNLIQAENNLEDLGYYVSLRDNPTSNYIFNFSFEFSTIVGCSISLYARYTEYQEKIEIYEFKTDKLAKINYDRFLDQRKQYITKINSSIKYYKNLIEVLDSEVDYEQNIESLKQELEDLQKYQYGRSGKFVWIGTKQAISDSKKTTTSTTTETNN